MMKAELEMQSGWMEIGGARLASTIARSTIEELGERVSNLMALSVRGLDRMYDPEGSVFPQTMRGSRSDSGPVLQSEGQNLRYAAIVALGVSRLPLPEQHDALHGSTALELAHLVSRRVVGHRDLGSLALGAWAYAEVTGQPASDLLDVLVRRATQEKALPVVVLSWTIAALIASGRLDQASTFAEDLLAVQGEAGIFPHTVPASAQGRVRAHVGCFADQVYPIQSLSRLYAATGEDRYLAAATRCGVQICALQGAEGQWWWHYDQRTGEVIEGFPVYSVHQHAMAPMALFELIDRLNRCDDFAKEAALGWLAHHQPDLVNEAITETGGPSL